MITGIEHTAIYANDTKTLADWYVKVFNTEIVYDNKKGVYFVAFKDKSMIEICPNDAVKNNLTELTEPGIRHIALSVDNFQETVTTLKNEGVTILKDAAVSEKGIGTFFFRDIEGNIFHLISRPVPLID
ncbi:MAG: VOC family protein [Alphaproteobacteria bacterium]|nr:VOC family protein [Alphaproteobacteria bacterium]